jgi:hypothetical protein
MKYCSLIALLFFLFVAKRSRFTAKIKCNSVANISSDHLFIFFLEQKEKIPSKLIVKTVLFRQLDFKYYESVCLCDW